MGAGASACGSEDSSAIFSQLMAKWDTLQEMPQYRSDVKKPGNPTANKTLLRIFDHHERAALHCSISLQVHDFMHDIAIKEIGGEVCALLTILRSLSSPRKL